MIDRRKAGRGMNEFWPAADICDRRWFTTDFDGKRWLHSCELPHHHAKKRHFCSCDASKLQAQIPNAPLLRPLPAIPGRAKTPEESFDQYLAKCGGVPDEGCGSDEAVFRAASWALHNMPDLSESSFINGIRRYQPRFDERWISQKWKAATRGR